MVPGLQSVHPSGMCLALLLGVQGVLPMGCPGLGELCVPGGAGLGKAERDRGAGTRRGKLGVLPTCSVLSARKGEIFLF